MSLKIIIEDLKKELEEKLKAQEEIFSISRKTLTLSKQAVMTAHRNEMNEAKEKLKEAQKMLQKLDNIMSLHRDLTLNITRVVYQEYAEAEIVIRLIETAQFPKPTELNVPVVPFLLGLADSVGEFRREALEALRKGKLKIAERNLQIMSDIYSELVALEDAYSLTPELRRKCDIARHLIEATTGDIASEKGRSSLEKAIKRLETKMK